MNVDEGILQRLARVELGLKGLDPRTFRNRLGAVGQAVFEATQAKEDQDEAIDRGFPYRFQVFGCNAQPIVGALVTASLPGHPNVTGLTDGQGLVLFRMVGQEYTWKFEHDRYETLVIPFITPPFGDGEVIGETLTPAVGFLDTPAGPTYVCFGGCGPVMLDGIVTDDYGPVAMVASNGADPRSDGCHVVAGTVATAYPTTPPQMDLPAVAGTYVIHYRISRLSPFSAGALATATVTGDAVSAITLTGGHEGTGYFDLLPAVTIEPPPAWAVPQRQATAHATLSYDAQGSIASIVIDDPGSGYDPASPPLVTIGGPNGRLYTLEAWGWNVFASQFPNGYVGQAPFSAGGDCATQGDIGSLIANVHLVSVVLEPSSYACDPFSATFDFTGTAADGTLFQGAASRIVTWTES